MGSDNGRCLTSLRERDFCGISRVFSPSLSKFGTLDREDDLYCRCISRIDKSHKDKKGTLHVRARMLTRRWRLWENDNADDPARCRNLGQSEGCPSVVYSSVRVCVSRLTCLLYVFYSRIVPKSSGGSRRAFVLRDIHPIPPFDLPKRFNPNFPPRRTLPLILSRVAETRFERDRIETRDRWRKTE